MRYTCYCCGRTNMESALAHVYTLCERCYMDIRSSDIRSHRNQVEYLDLRHSGLSDERARRQMAPMDTNVG